MFLTLFSTLALGVLCNPAQQVRLGQTVQLGKFGPGPSDHATLALNQYGDICVAYQTRQASGQRLVEAQILRYSGTSYWSSNSSLRLILGDPSVNLYGPLRDNCTKPDIVALDDASFVVVWPRGDLQDKQVGQLEVARIETRDAAGFSLPNPVLHSAAAGLGYVVDPLVVVGDAGIMPDLTPLAGGQAAAVYATEDSRTVAGNGDIFRDYSIRTLRMDWTFAPSDLNFSGGPVTLASNIPMDSDALVVFAGGLILPDVNADDNENLVVAWEQYRQQGRPGYSGNDRGEVAVARYEGFSSATPLALLNENLFSAPLAYLQQRRPCLSTSHADSANVVLVSWIDLNDAPSASSDVRFKEIVYGPGGGQPTVNDRFWVNDPLLDESHPVPSQTITNQRCFATRQLFNQRLILGSSQSSLSTFQIASPVKFPERVAAEVIETTTHSGSPLSVLVISYEGANLNDPDLYRVFVGLFRI